MKRVKGEENLENLEKIEIIIYEMRQSLYELINKKQDLLDVEVIEASQELDKALNEYNIILNKVDK